VIIIAGVMRALIYGGGSVGLGVGSCLIRAGADVDILAREEAVAALRAEGLFRRGIFGEYWAEAGRFGSYSSLDEIKGRVYDYILVCVKSYDSLSSAEDISRREFLLGEEGKIVLFQNGWGNAEVFLSFFGRERIYNARVITGFRRVGPNEVEVTVHADSIHIGSLFGYDLGVIEGLCGLISEGGIACEVSGDIEKDLWAKMLYNCALNPLGAVLDVRYGALAEHEFTRVIMGGIVEEVFEVMGRGIRVIGRGRGIFWRSSTVS